MLGLKLKHVSKVCVCVCVFGGGGGGGGGRVGFYNHEKSILKFPHRSRLCMLDVVRVSSIINISAYIFCHHVQELANIGPVLVVSGRFWPICVTIFTWPTWRRQVQCFESAVEFRDFRQTPGTKMASNRETSNGSWCMGIKGDMSGTVCVTFTWDMYTYELFIAFVCFVVCSLL